MIFSVESKDTREKLKQLEREELEDYCREQGFTKEQTELFVKNSIDNTYPQD